MKGSSVQVRFPAYFFRILGKGFYFFPEYVKVTVRIRNCPDTQSGDFVYNKCVDVKGEDTDETNMETNMETSAGSSVDTAAYGACNGRCRNPDAGDKAAGKEWRHIIGEMKVHFLDVGQGLSILAQSEGKTMIYDGGDKKTSRFVVAYLKETGSDRD